MSCLTWERRRGRTPHLTEDPDWSGTSRCPVTLIGDIRGSGLFGVAALVISREESPGLEARRRARSLPASDGRRAHIVLRLAEGGPQDQAAGEPGGAINSVRLGRQRFITGRLAGRAGRHQGRKPKTDTPALEARAFPR